MSIGPEGVKFAKPKRRRGAIFMFGLIALEGIFSFFLYMSMAGRIFETSPVNSAAGVPQLLSYQGRLSDSSGNPLGGTGTVYCFRYSLYDAPTGGSKLWPTGTPTNSTTTVTDGIFSDQIGRADTLTYDFFSTSTIYLNVDVNQTTSTCGGAWDTLSPRQQISASGFALTSENVYGSSIWMPTSTKVQIGTAAGTSPGNQTLLSLDIVNTGSETIGAACTNNGSLWYNSTNLRALICENSTIQEIGNGDVIAGIRAESTSTVISTGEVVLSASTNITINQAGNTLNFSVADPGGPQRTISNLSWPQGIALSSVNLAQGYVSYGSLRLENGNFLTATRAAILASGSIASNSSGALSISIGIYTLNAGTLSLITQSSGTQSYSYTSNASSAVSGLRRISVPLNVSMTPGNYYYGIRISTANAGSFSIARGAGVTAAFSGNLGVASATSRHLVYGVGISSSAALPTNIAVSTLQGGGTAGYSGMPWILFTNQDLN